ncbi:TPA: hypothetical protein DEO28_05180 [Candidatus Dependentiae bacterium]|nr:MAG: ADP-heptose:LPS heptosyltransferase [candidate division TM6 bacterium GW2011_GWE2_31_21]KKP53946.1 MAG: ADP-heptose:LPS heptosyltransferase [candidate division TM6 bacterium GW2011_GWF2_33_332]HBS47726.1 hypothetical protein [Candidatus Dependentiae bacterium]HBZ73875.1 hypothetical protein [Candidatus Dependentiae bacterium]
MSSKKTLFITHLAIGDFLYMQPYFKKLTEKLSFLKIDLCVDESRGKSSFWFNFFKKPQQSNAVVEWAKKSNIFDIVYHVTSNPKSKKEFLQKAAAENYIQVISFGCLRPWVYNDYTEKISKSAFKAGIRSNEEKYDRNLNMFLKDSLPNCHITDLYGFWFERLFNFKLKDEEKLPQIEIDKKIETSVLAKHPQMKNRSSVFINAFASNKKRSWPMENVASLISELKKIPKFANQNFIVNIPPQEVENFENKKEIYKNENIIFFTAKESFFELPAMLSLCNLVISVETSTMHLAQALKIPQIALMRTKSPEWKPYKLEESKIIFAPKDLHIKSITPQEVLNKIKCTFCQTS